MKGPLIREAQRRYRREGGAEMERERRQRRKREDFFGYRVQFARRHDRTITRDDLVALWDGQGGRCALTGRELTFGAAELDHVVPLARGGDPGLVNMRWACREANRGKRDLTDAEFVALCADVLEVLGRG